MTTTTRLLPFQRIASENLEINQLQDAVSTTLAQLLQVPILDGNLITDIELQAGVLKDVEHKLGREPLGYFIAKQTSLATSNIGDAATVQLKQNFVTLFSTSAVTLDIWVF